MQSRQSLTFDQKGLMLVHMVRDRVVLEKTAEKVSPEDFSSPLDTTYRLVWSIAREHYRKYKEPISKDYLLVEMRAAIENEPSLFPIPEEKNLAFRFIDQLYAWDPNNLIADIGLELAQRFLDEQRILGFSMQGSAGDLVQRLTNEYFASRINPESERLDVMSEDAPFYSTEPRIPTGCMFVDCLLGGGIRPKETYCLLGPTGGGKTMLSLQVACEVARQLKHVMFLSYEQPVIGDLSTRLYSYLSNSSRKEIEGKRSEDIDPKIMRKINEQRRIVGPYLHTYNFCGTKAGFGGLDELSDQLYTECQEGRHPTLVVVDWLLPMVQRWMARTNKRNSDDPNAVRVQVQRFADGFLKLADMYDTTLLITHQLSCEASQKSPANRPSWTEAAECRSLSWLMSFTLTIGVKDPSTGCCWLLASKARSLNNMEKILHLNGEYNRFDDVSHLYTVERRGGTGVFKKIGEESNKSLYTAG